MAQDTDKQEVILRIASAPEYRGVFVTEATGGVGPAGIVVMDLCHDYRGQPEELHGRMLPGNFGEIVDKGPTIMVREKQIRIYMTADSAVRIGNWLAKHGTAAMSGKGSDATTVDA